MSVEINDQKLIDIVYVDDEDNKHKYSGPFINDLTITSEIQEKLDALDTLNTQIGELKTKLDTINTSVTTSGSKIKYVTELPDELEANTCYVLPPDDALVIKIVQDNIDVGWVDYNQIKLLSNNSIYYLDIKKDEDLYVDTYLTCIGTNWIPSNLPEVASINIGGTLVYENATLVASANVSLSSSDINLTVQSPDGDSWQITLKPGFKPEE